MFIYGKKIWRCSFSFFDFNIYLFSTLIFWRWDPVSIFLYWIVPKIIFHLKLTWTVINCITNPYLNLTKKSRTFYLETKQSAIINTSVNDIKIHMKCLWLETNYYGTIIYFCYLKIFNANCNLLCLRPDWKGILFSSSIQTGWKSGRWVPWQFSPINCKRSLMFQRIKRTMPYVFRDKVNFMNFNFLITFFLSNLTSTTEFLKKTVFWKIE